MRASISGERGLVLLALAARRAAGVPAGGVAVLFPVDIPDALSRGAVTLVLALASPVAVCATAKSGERSSVQRSTPPIERVEFIYLVKINNNKINSLFESIKIIVRTMFALLGPQQQNV
jgi:hypothetical protein